MSLLPGLRDVRVPLVSGLLWLLTGWILLEPHLPTEDAPAPLSSIYALGNYFGSSSVTAAVLFAAYLVGIILPFYRIPLARAPGTPLATQHNIKSFVTSIQRRLQVDASTASDVAQFAFNHIASVSGRKTVNVAQARRLPRAAGSFLGDVELDEQYWVDVSNVVYGLDDERAALATRLRIQDKERLYQAYDRHVSEAEFRQGVAFPLAVLVVVIASTTGEAVSLAALVVPWVLIVLARRSRSSANSELYQALVNNQIAASVTTTPQPGRQAALQQSAAEPRT